MVAAMLMKHDVDPKDEIYEAVGVAASQVEVMGAQVLVAIYIRPKKTAGGIWTPDSAQDEDIYQGKVGLILKMGPMAFEEDETHKFPVKPKVGDWVVFRIGDTFSFNLNKRYCRLAEDIYVRAIIQSPDVVM